MSQAENHHKINYIEFAATDVARAKQFYAAVFGWSFQDWGPDYISFEAATAGVHGGFRTAKPEETRGDAAPLVVLYSTDLKATEKAIVAAGGTIVVPTFEYPGGRRFHFSDGVGNRVGGLVGVTEGKRNQGSGFRDQRALVGWRALIHSRNLNSERPWGGQARCFWRNSRERWRASLAAAAL
jgi:uncharacterized protein